MFCKVTRKEENEYETSIQCYIQGITLTVLDKLMLCQITSYSVIYYLGIFYPDFFDKNKMIINCYDMIMRSTT